MKFTPELGRLGLEGTRATFRTSPSQLHQWLRRIDRWIAYANSVVKEEVLHPEVVRRAISWAINELNAPTDTVVPRRTGLQAELTILEQELVRLTAAVAQGGDLKPLLDGIQTRERRRGTLQAELAGLEGLRPVTALELQQLQREIEVRLADWRDLLSRQVAQGRQILKKLLVGRIVFRQREDGIYEFSGQASLGRIIAGLACTKTVVAPTGFATLCSAPQVRGEVHRRAA